MKCLNCGARVRKNEELCPECGAYISTDKETYVLTPQRTPEEEIDLEALEKAEEEVRNIDSEESGLKIEEYNFRDYLILPSFIKIGGGLVLLFAVIFSFVKNPIRYNDFTTILCLFFSLFTIFTGVSSIIQEKDCKLTVTPEKVYGTIPVDFFSTEAIDINIEDIIAVNETGFHSRHPNPKVHIVTKEKEITVKGSSSIMLKDFSKTLQNKAKVLKGESE
ncbi:MAG: zinc ribbon domain-containing protein [Clostridia bacterium]|nr:zinc ribbon domain-containing protein [Clostridia bacterium]